MMSEVVQTKCGPIRGLLKKTDQHCAYSAFFGIPYATQPLDELQFRDPVPPTPWKSILDATQYPKKALQLNNYLPTPVVEGFLDSLILNVFTPSHNMTEDSLPVIVYIHGGAFLDGSSAPEVYGPDYMVEKGIILVTIQYRLGVYGFLSFKDPSIGIPGNAGLKDQVMSLRWVQENIKYFGGDRENVTLMGHSAGAASVHYHMLSPMSKDLFHKACMISGSAFMPCALSFDETNFTARLSKSLGFESDEDEQIMLKTIFSVSPEKLIKASFAVLSEEEKLQYGWKNPFIPKVELYNKENNCFLPQPPTVLQKHPWSCNIPMLVIAAADEGLMYCHEKENQLKAIRKNREMLLPAELRMKLAPPSIEKIRILKETYFGTSVDLETGNEFFLKYISHKCFIYPMYRTIVKSPNLKKYFCHLETNHVEEFKFCKWFWSYCKIQGNKGTNHCDDIAFLFKQSNDRRPDGTYRCWWAAHKYLRAITELAITGKPGSEWEPFAGEEKCLIVGADKWEMDSLPDKKEMCIWNEVYDDE